MNKLSLLLLNILIIFCFPKCMQLLETSLKRDDVCDAETCESQIDPSTNSSPINVLITFANAANNFHLQDRFQLTVSSMLKRTNYDINLYILGDLDSWKIAQNLLKEFTEHNSKIKLKQLDIHEVITKTKPMIESLQKYFSPGKKGSYYSQYLFFLSPLMHRILPDKIRKIIMLDSDLKFDEDILKLYKLFDEFQEDNVIGIAKEGQPVYRHTFYDYRNKNPGTKVGEPPPDGLTGFNSGVLLLDLGKMRQSGLYNDLLLADTFSKLASEFQFRGHLGDQDFYTLISMKYTSLFYILPCQWNRQLCQWWKDKGYEDVFNLYFDCPGHINIHHGNCNTPIP